MVTYQDPESGKEATAFTTVAQHAGDIPAGTFASDRARPRVCAREGMVAMTEHAYRVVVTREDGAWLADIPELAGAHTYARTLPALDRAVREVIVMAADRPDED